MTPAPTTATRRLTASASREHRCGRRLRASWGWRRYAGGERVALVEQQRALGRHVRPAGDYRQHAAARRRLVARLEHAADHALLAVSLAGRERAVRRQAGELGAGAGAA